MKNITNEGFASPPVYGSKEDWDKYKERAEKAMEMNKKPVDLTTESAIVSGNDVDISVKV